MGLLSNIKKEMYINQLASSFKLFYSCGDMAAIECMRKNYSSNELKLILENLKKAAGGKMISGFQLEAISPFKEDHSEVYEINMKHCGR